MNEEEGLECEVHVGGVRLEHMSEFKYLEAFWMNQVQVRHSFVGRWQIGEEL